MKTKKQLATRRNWIKANLTQLLDLLKHEDSKNSLTDFEKNELEIVIQTINTVLFHWKQEN